MDTLKSKFSFIALFVLFSEGAMAGLAAHAVSVPIDSPWMIMGLSVVLATVGIRLFKNRRK